MKKLLTILATFSLALAVTAVAENDQAPGQKKKQAGPGGPHGGGRPAPAAAAAHGRGPAMHAQPPAAAAHAQVQGPHGPKAVHNVPNVQRAPHPTVEHSQAQSRITGPQHNGRKAASAPAPASNPAATAPANARDKNNRKVQAQQLKQPPAPSAPTAPTAPNPPVATGKPNPQPGAHGGHAKKLDPQVVQKIRSEHNDFRAQPRPDKVPAVSFRQDYRINGSQNWQGEKYARFRSYRPEMHDRGWYSSRYNRVEIIGGGAYYWNGGYWYPAWGYDPGAQYYPYDGPIYVGSRALPPDRVIADVQAALLEQGYYQGEVDGLLGPLTRQALTAYQADNGLYTTAAIDEPTLDALGMG